MADCQLLPHAAIAAPKVTMSGWSLCAAILLVDIRERSVLALRSKMCTRPQQAQSQLPVASLLAGAKRGIETFAIGRNDSISAYTGQIKQTTSFTVVCKLLDCHWILQSTGTGV